MKKNSTLIKELRRELRYWQMQVRTESRWLKGSKDKCREIGKKMRELQGKINE